MNWRVLVGDVRERLADVESGSVQTCVTSPPYWGLRDYGHVGQIGVEQAPAAYVAAITGVCVDVRRTLRADGTLWLNLGDCYAQSGMGGNPNESPYRKQATNVRRKAPDGLKPKDLVGIPWMVAFALREAGWYLRADIIWAKPNPMPESVTDRPTKAHEYVFLLSKRKRYYFDAEAVAEPLSESTIERWAGGGKRFDGHDEYFAARDGGRKHIGQLGKTGLPPKGVRNCRSVWTIPTQPYPEAHFATFPEAVPEKCIKAGSRIGDVVLDPFCGSGTTGQVAVQLGRQFVGIELNPTYAELARTRISGAAPLFSRELTEAAR